jgi:hypothetical protein
VRALLDALSAYIAIPQWLIQGREFDDFFDELDNDSSNTINLHEFKQVVSSVICDL